MIDNCRTSGEFSRAAEHRVQWCRRAGGRRSGSNESSQAAARSLAPAPIVVDCHRREKLVVGIVDDGNDIFAKAVGG